MASSMLTIASDAYSYVFVIFPFLSPGANRAYSHSSKAFIKSEIAFSFTPNEESFSIILSRVSISIGIFSLLPTYSQRAFSTSS